MTLLDSGQAHIQSSDLLWTELVKHRLHVCGRARIRRPKRPPPLQWRFGLKADKPMGSAPGEGIWKSRERALCLRYAVSKSLLNVTLSQFICNYTARGD